MPKTKQQPKPKVEDRTPRAWFNIKNLRPRNDIAPSSADVYIYDVIGGWFGIAAQDFVQAIAALDVEQINLYVNSPGGDVFDGVSIRNALARHPANVSATVDGIAASIASVVLTGANDVSMASGSMLMIHDAGVFAIGNAQDLRDTADILDKLSNNIAAMYAGKAGGTTKDWRALMLEETWYNADEAVAAGLADAVVETPEPQATNKFDLSVFAHAGREDAPEPPIAVIRAAALLHPVAEFRPAAIATDLVPPSGAASTPELPAKNQKEAAVVPTAPAPEAQVEPQNEPPAASALSAADITAIGEAFGAQLAPFFENFAAINNSGVPASFASGKKAKGTSYRDTLRLITAKNGGTANADQLSAYKQLLTQGAFSNTLDNISLDDATLGGLVNTNRPQWIGELIAQVPYSGVWDVIQHADLLSPRVTAFVMQTLPTGGTKADGGGAVTSTGAKWVLDTFDTARWAGADSFDRTLKDFGIDATALDSYFRAQLRNYYIWRDATVITAMKASISAAAAAAIPSGSAIDPVMNQILDGVGTVLSQGGGVSNLAVLPVALFKSLLKNSYQMAPAFLNVDLGSLSDGDVEGKLRIVPDLSATVPSGDVLVGNGAGFTGYELPDSPVRAEQLQVSIGNVDIGLFGYCLGVRQSVNYFTLVSAAS